MTYHSGMLLVNAGKIAGQVDKGDQRNVESVTVADEPGRLVRRVDVKHTGHLHGLVRNESHRAASHAAKAYNHVACVHLLYLKEIGIVSHRPDHLLNIIWQRRVTGNNAVNIIVAVGRGRIGNNGPDLVVTRNE